jgi:hypothetical protein
MARTYRFRKECGYLPWFANLDHKRYSMSKEWEPSARIAKYVGRDFLFMWEVPKPQKEQRRIDALEHRDRSSYFKEPGPAFFRNLYTERPLRRESKRQLKKFLLTPEFEVILDSKGKLEYWT